MKFKNHDPKAFYWLLQIQYIFLLPLNHYHFNLFIILLLLILKQLVLQILISSLFLPPQHILAAIKCKHLWKFLYTLLIYCQYELQKTPSLQDEWFFKRVKVLRKSSHYQLKMQVKNLILRILATLFVHPQGCRLLQFR